MKIVTNGKRFRIQCKDGSFYTTWVSDPDGGWSNIFETRFYLRALRRLGNLKRGRALGKDKWTAV